MTSSPHPTSNHDAHVPTIAWVAVSLLAIAVGYHLGQLDKAPPAITTAADSHTVSAKDIPLTARTVADIARAAGRWVVTLETEPLHPDESEPEHVVPGLLPYAPSRGGGTGIIFRPDGYIVTSNHVLGLDRKVFAYLSNHKAYIPKVIGRDWFTDVAVLKIDAEGLPCARFADSSQVEPGDWAIAIGTPMRLDHTVSLGIVSAIDRTISDTIVPGMNLIQTDAAINPGNSGGPLLNIEGEVIGMNTAINRRAQNIAFAVPAEEVKAVADALISDGRIDRGYLGLYMENPVDRPNEPSLDKGGVFVIFAKSDGPAARAGVVAGDLIKSVNAEPVHNITDLRRIVMPLKPGERVTLNLLHPNGIQSQVSFTLDQPPAEAQEPRSGA